MTLRVKENRVLTSYDRNRLETAEKLFALWDETCETLREQGNGMSFATFIDCALDSHNTAENVSDEFLLKEAQIFVDEVKAARSPNNQGNDYGHDDNDPNCTCPDCNPNDSEESEEARCNGPDSSPLCG